MTSELKYNLQWNSGAIFILSRVSGTIAGLPCRRQFLLSDGRVASGNMKNGINYCLHFLYQYYVPCDWLMRMTNPGCSLSIAQWDRPQLVHCEFKKYLIWFINTSCSGPHLPSIFLPAFGPQWIRFGHPLFSKDNFISHFMLYYLECCVNELWHHIMIHYAGNRIM